MLCRRYTFDLNDGWARWKMFRNEMDVKNGVLKVFVCLDDENSRIFCCDVW